MHESVGKSKRQPWLMLQKFSTSFTPHVIILPQLLHILRSGHHSSYRKEDSDLAYLLLANGFGLGTPIDLTPVQNAAWIGLPSFTAPSFHVNAMVLIAPVAIILVAENLGHIKAVSAMTGRDLDPYLGRAFLGDATATVVSGFGGGTGVTTYSEEEAVAVTDSAVDAPDQIQPEPGLEG